eukprot:7139926-Pyramimonas_sp.AAC.1
MVEGRLTCEKGGQWQSAMTLFCEMVALLTEMVALLSEMLIVKLEPAMITCGAVDSACEKSRRWQWQQA